MEDSVINEPKTYYCCNTEAADWLTVEAKRNGTVEFASAYYGDEAVSIYLSFDDVKRLHEQLGKVLAREEK